MREEALLELACRLHPANRAPAVPICNSELEDRWEYELPARLTVPSRTPVSVRHPDRSPKSPNVHPQGRAIGHGGTTYVMAFNPKRLISPKPRTHVQLTSLNSSVKVQLHGRTLIL
jgi:hypothetical protein